MVNRRSFLKGSAALTAQVLGGQALLTTALINKAEAQTGFPVGLLKSQLQGDRGSMILVPTDKYYANYNISFNKRTEIAPQVRVLPIDSQAVSKTILWARENNVPFAIRSGGHSYEGYSQSAGLVIDVRFLNQMTFDAPSQTASVGSGIKLGKLYEFLSKYGMALPAGSCPTVGVAGHTLGGGFGLIGRKFGLAADSLVSCEIVDAQGQILNASEKENPDLFWALRGGGNGNFGIVTKFVFRTHKLLNVATFGISWVLSPEQALDVARTWQEWAPQAPDDITSFFRISKGPGGLIKLRSSGLTTGTPIQLEAELQKVLRVRKTSSVLIKPMSFIQSVNHFSGPDGYPSVFMKAKSNYVFDPMSDDGLKTLIASIQKQSPGVTSVFDAYGGAIARKQNADTAFSHREGTKYAIQLVTEWSEAEKTNAHLKSIRKVHEDIRPYVSAAAYVNYCDLDLKDYAQAYWGENLERLIDVKTAVDPDNFFRHSQSIPVRAK